MYGIVEIGGHQYRVAPGDVVDVNKLAAEAGTTVDIEDVLFVSGETPLVGLPTVAGAKVKAQVIKHDRDRKVIVFKRKPGNRQTKRGHRQQYTALLITEVDNGQGAKETLDPKSAVAQKYLKK